MMASLWATLPASLALGLRQLFDGAVLRILLKSLAVTLVLFVLVTAAGWFVIDQALAGGGLDDALFAGAGAARGVLALMLALFGLWFAWRIVAMAVVQFFADEVVQAVELRHYPAEATGARELSLARQARNAARGAGRALLFNLAAAPFALALLFTGIGPFAVFWLVNAVLLGRELQDMVWLRHRQDKAHLPPVNGAERFLLGGMIAAMLAVPFVNFLAPVLGAAAATHLVHLAGRRGQSA